LSLNFIPKTPVGRALAEAVASHREAACAFDLRGSQLLAWNVPAARLWGIDAGQREPLPVDRAMPAFNAMRVLETASPGQSAGRRLTFWTPKGKLDEPCSSHPFENHASLIVVTWHGTEVGEAPVASDTKPAITRSRPMAVAAADEATLQEIARRIRQRGATGNGEAESPPLAAKVTLDQAPAPPAALAQLVHELRTPLAAIIALAETMTGEHFGPLPNERYRGYVRDMRESARHALTLVEGLAGSEQADGDKLDLIFAEVDLNGLALACVSAMQPLADKEGLKLTAELEEHLPRVIADGRSIRQILLNLLSNCCKHTGSGTAIVVRTGYEIAGPVWFEVADNGPGIPPGIAARIMEGPTGSASVAERSRSGLGLGLPLSRRLAEANGGQLEIGNESPRGARVRVLFAKGRVVPI
jgi:signal transduction histidine kinase